MKGAGFDQPTPIQAVGRDLGCCVRALGSDDCWFQGGWGTATGIDSEDAFFVLPVTQSEANSRIYILQA